MGPRRRSRRRAIAPRFVCFAAFIMAETQRVHQHFAFSREGSRGILNAQFSLSEESTHTFPSHPHIKVCTLSVCLRRRSQMSRHHVLMCLMKHRWKGTRRMMCFFSPPFFFLVQTGLSLRTRIKDPVRSVRALTRCIKTPSGFFSKAATLGGPPHLRAFVPLNLLVPPPAAATHPQLSPLLSVCNGPGEEQEGREINKGTERETQEGKESRNWRAMEGADKRRRERQRRRKRRRRRETEARSLGRSQAALSASVAVQSGLPAPPPGPENILAATHAISCPARRCTPLPGPRRPLILTSFLSSQVGKSRPTSVVLSSQQLK